MTFNPETLASQIYTTHYTKSEIKEFFNRISTFASDGTTIQDFETYNSPLAVTEATKAFEEIENHIKNYRYILKITNPDISNLVGLTSNSSYPLSFQTVFTVPVLNEKLTTTIYSNPCLATNLANLRTIPGLTCNRLDITSKISKSFKVDASANSLSAYVGLESVSYLDPVSHNSLPDWLVKILPPVQLEKVLINPANFLNHVLASNPYLKNIDFQNIREGIESQSLHLGASLHTPIAIYDLATIKSEIDMVLAGTISIKAIKVQKLKQTFELVEISLKELFDNSGKYIANLEMPKLITYVAPIKPQRNGGALRVRFIGPVQTFVIPPCLFTTSSKTIAETTGKLLQALAFNTLETLLNQTALEKTMNEFPELSKYWKTSVELIGINSKDLKPCLARITHPTFKFDKILSASNAKLSKVFTSPIFNELEINKKLIRSSETAKKKMEGVVNYTTDRLFNTEHLLKQLNRDLINAQTEQADLSIENSRVKENYNILKREFSQHLQNNAPITEDFLKLASELDYVTELSSKNLILNKIVMMNRFSLGTFPIFLRDLDANGLFAFLNLVSNPDYYITAVEGFTPTPVNIYVDNATKAKEDCEKVIGGPYRVVVTYSSATSTLIGHVFLNEIGSIYGVRPIDETTLELKQHPHSTPFKISKNVISDFIDFINSPSRMCFGEIESLLKQAFESSNFEMVQRYIETWITNCWSQDQWGRQWSWFPKANEITLKGN